MSSLPIVLVTGATGSTGVELVNAAASTGKFHVRAGVRDPEKARNTFSTDKHKVEIVKLDDQANTISSAFHGVTAVYLLSAPGAPFDAWLSGAVKAGVKHVIYHSATTAYPGSPCVVFGEEHLQHEKAVKNAGLNSWTIFRPTFFHQNIEKFQLQSIVNYHQYGGSAGTGKFTSVDVRDVAAAAVAIWITKFQDPTKHKGQTYELTGVVTTEQEIAAEISKVVGHTVTYNTWSVEEHKQKMTEWGLPEWLQKEQLGLDQIKRENKMSQLDPHLEQLIGRKPITIHQYITEIKSLLSGQKK